jgi:hypothetical protein
VVAQTRFKKQVADTYRYSVLSLCPTTFRLKLRYLETEIFFGYFPIEFNDDLPTTTGSFSVQYIVGRSSRLARLQQDFLRCNTFRHGQYRKTFSRLRNMQGTANKGISRLVVFLGLNTDQVYAV